MKIERIQTGHQSQTTVAFMNTDKILVQLEGCMRLLRNPKSPGEQIALLSRIQNLSVQLNKATADHINEIKTRKSFTSGLVM